MSTEEINIAIGRTKAKFSFDKKITDEGLIRNVVNELNIEYNRILNNMGKMNETIMLFFLLFKTEATILKDKKENLDVFFIQILSNLKNFIQIKKDEDIKEILSLNQKLVVINIYKKIEFLTIKETLFGNRKDDCRQDIESFVENIKQEIRRIENSILLL